MPAAASGAHAHQLHTVTLPRAEFLEVRFTIHASLKLTNLGLRASHVPVLHMAIPLLTMRQ